MDQDEISPSVTSSTLRSFSLLSPATIGSPYSPWTREFHSNDFTSEESGLYLLHLLINCANHVVSNNLDHSNMLFNQISPLASPEGGAVQRMASYFTEALARKSLHSCMHGFYRALTSTTQILNIELAQARMHFLDLCPLIRIAFTLSDQAILEAMESEKMIHIIDLNGTDPLRWVGLLKSLSALPGGPPYLRITSVNEHPETLNHMLVCLSEAAEKLDIPFQFNPIIGRIDNLDIASFPVKMGEALAISSVSQLHYLLASEERSPSRKQSKSHLSRMRHGTLGEMFEKEGVNGYKDPSPDSVSSSPVTVTTTVKMESFLNSVWNLAPKIMVLTEQEANHNEPTLHDRLAEALNYYGALFDCLESTVAKSSVERMRVEKTLFGEEIRNIIACDGLERKERHEKLERWVHRLEMARFGSVPFGFIGYIQARRMLQEFGCDDYKIKEDNGGCFLCWKHRPLFSVSAWRSRRYDSCS